VYLFSRSSRHSSQYAFASATETSRTSSRYESQKQKQKKEYVGAHFAVGDMHLRPMLAEPVRPSQPSESINRLRQRRRIRSIRRRFRKSIHNKINRDSYIYNLEDQTVHPRDQISLRTSQSGSLFPRTAMGRRTHLICALHARSLLVLVFVECCG